MAQQKRFKRIERYLLNGQQATPAQFWATWNQRLLFVAEGERYGRVSQLDQGVEIAIEFETFQIVYQEG